MITQLQLENWKSYENSVLEIDPLTMLIGTNASGKSNALDAFQFLNRISGGAMISSALQGDGALAPLRGGVEWAARRPKSVFAISVVCRADDATDYDYRLECKVVENRCDVWSEQLQRIKYRQNKEGVRTGSIAGRIKLFRTDPCVKNSPTIVGRLYNEKQGVPRTLGRAHALLFQLASLVMSFLLTILLGNGAIGRTTRQAEGYPWPTPRADGRCT